MGLVGSNRKPNRCSKCGAVGFTVKTHPEHLPRRHEETLPEVAHTLEENKPASVAGPRIEYSRYSGKRGRRRAPRAKTITVKSLTRNELRVGALLYPPVEGIERPRTRGECREEQRPCPWVACKHHLYLDINPDTGSIKINFPDLEPWELKHTCSLDVAERGGVTLEEVGEITNLTRERIRQVEVRGLLKLKWGSQGPEDLGTEPTRPKRGKAA